VVGGEMIYRSWSLLSSTVAVWGGAAAAGTSSVYLSGGKVCLLSPSPLCWFVLSFAGKLFGFIPYLINL
jgi:hypothetical protein